MQSLHAGVNSMSRKSFKKGSGGMMGYMVRGVFYNPLCPPLKKGDLREQNSYCINTI